MTLQQLTKTHRTHTHTPQNQAVKLTPYHLSTIVFGFHLQQHKLSSNRTSASKPNSDNYGDTNLFWIGKLSEEAKQKRTGGASTSCDEIEQEGGEKNSS
jgi:hypothetical protein